MISLTFKEFSRINRRRLEEYPFGNCAEWMLTDWTNAVAGEVGELCNKVKKIRRGDYTADEIRDQVAEEIADAVTYLDLVAHRLDLGDLGELVKEKFNTVSRRWSCPLLIPPFTTPTSTTDNKAHHE